MIPDNIWFHPNEILITAIFTKNTFKKAVKKGKQFRRRLCPSLRSLEIDAEIGDAAKKEKSLDASRSWSMDTPPSRSLISSDECVGPYDLLKAGFAYSRPTDSHTLREGFCFSLPCSSNASKWMKRPKRVF